MVSQVIWAPLPVIEHIHVPALAATLLEHSSIAFGAEERWAETCRVQGLVHRALPSLLTRGARGEETIGLDEQRAPTEPLPPVQLGLDTKTGVALMRINMAVSQRALALGFESSVRLLKGTQAGLRAVILHLENEGSGSVASCPPSNRAMHRVRRAAGMLCQLYVPVVGCACGHVFGVALTILDAADYRIVERSSLLKSRLPVEAQRARVLHEVVAEAWYAFERAQLFAGWLAQHPPIGLRHVLALTRPDNDLGSLHHVSGTLRRVLHLCARSYEVTLQLHVHFAHADLDEAAAATRAVRQRQQPELLALAVSTLREPSMQSGTRQPSQTVGIVALELYMPRDSVTAAALETQSLCPGTYTRGTLHSQLCRCGAAEDVASMALTAVRRLCANQNLGLEAVGMFQFASHDLLDRSKCVKTEIMALAGSSADAEGIDRYDGCTGGDAALQACFDWMQSASWDGRYAVVVCSDDPSSSSGLAGSAAVAVLIGPNAPLAVSRAPTCGIPSGAPWFEAPVSDTASPRSLLTEFTLPPEATRSGLLAVEKENAVQGDDSQMARVHQAFDRRHAEALRGAAQIGRLATTAHYVALCSLLLRQPRLHGSRIALAPAEAELVIRGVASVHAPPPEELVHHDPAAFALLCRRQKGSHLQPRHVSFSMGALAADTFSISAIQNGRREYALTEALLTAYVPRPLSVVSAPTEDTVPSHKAGWLAAQLADPSILAQLVAMQAAGASLASFGTEAPVAMSRVVDVEAALLEASAGLLPTSTSTDAPLLEAGLDSLGTIELRNRLQLKLEIELPETLVFDFPTMRTLEEHIREAVRPAPVATPPALSLANLVGPPTGLGCVPHDGSVTRSIGATMVSVAATSFTLPGGVRTVQLQSNVARTGRDLVGLVPADRWEMASVHAGSEAEQRTAQCMSHGGFTTGAELFDHRRFSISTVEAIAMDPQQRILLEHGSGALTRSGALQEPGGSDAGVAVGITQTEFARILEYSPSAYSVQAATGATLSIASGRLSYVIGLQGPCVALDTACSSALVACHVALRALRGGECREHLAAGVNLMLHPCTSAGLAAAGMLSLSGRSHTFDARADGFARGEGCVALALRCAPGNVLLRGSATRQDGRSASLTAPNGQAQQRLLRFAHEESAVSAAELTLNEGHGTGTALGDPIETGSLQAAVLAMRAAEPEALALVSWKANAGHAEPAAGTAGLLQLLLSLVTATALPNAQLRALNSHVHGALRGAPCAFPLQATVRRGHVGGVSSFGFSGTIAHAVLQADHACHALHQVARRTALRLRRFAWSVPERSGAKRIDDEAVRHYVLGWVVTQPIDIRDASSLTLLISSRHHRHHLAFPAGPHWSTVVLTLASADISAPSLCAASLAIGLIQSLALLEAPPECLVLLTSGVQNPIHSGCPPAASSAAHGGCLGTARVLELEYPSMRVLASDVGAGGLSAAAGGLLDVCVRWCGREGQLAWHGKRKMVPRLRSGGAIVTSTAALTPGGSQLLCETFVLTGGLGGLGLRAAVLLERRHMCRRLVLSSRSGKIARDGQGLARYLRSLRSSTLQVSIVPCDVGDAYGAASMLHREAGVRSIGLLHAAGLGDKGLVRDLRAGHIHPVYAPKAVGASHLARVTEGTVMASTIFFSSVAAGIGQVGQANYAASNAFLDLLAQVCRMVGRVDACSMQLPYIQGAGMGAASIDASLTVGSRGGVFKGLAALSLDVYADSLHALLVPSVAHGLNTSQLPQSRGNLWETLTDASLPRFSELSVTQAVSVTVSVGGVISAMEHAQRRAHVDGLVMTAVKELSSDEVESVDTPLMEAGIDSLAATELSARLRTLSGVSLSPTLVFEQPTPRAISAHLLEHLGGECNVPTDVASAAPASVGAHLSITAPLRLAAAVGRWAGGGDRAALRYTLLRASGDAVGAVPSHKRWNLSDAVDSSALSPSQLACAHHGGFIAAAEVFDNASFRVSTAEAEVMDPQQRLLLEVGYMALHSADIRRALLTGGDDGVFVGIERPDWALLQALRHLGAQQTATPSAFAMTGDTINVAAGRLSFVLGMQGPCVSIDTACSSALAALHAAGVALLGGESAQAVALAVSLKLLPQPTLGAAAAGMLSTDGRCKTLDKRANGYVRSEAIGAIVLQSPTTVAGESHAGLAGSSVRQDGRSASLTAPNGSAQRALLLRALSRAGLTARDVQTIEAHGTGTALGDPTEAGALVAALDATPATGQRTLGAAKANVGHAEAASGQVGLLRAIEQLCCGGNAQLRVLNPLVTQRLGGATSGQAVHLAVQANAEAWQAGPSRTAFGVSAFGYSGTISHALLEGQKLLDLMRGHRRRVHITRLPFAWVKVTAPHKNESEYIEFLGRLQPASGLAQEWEQLFLPYELAFLQGHRVGWVPLLPGTCYIELARAMVCATRGKRVFTLSKTEFENILFLDDTDIRGAPSLRLRHEPASGAIGIFSRQSGTAWINNASMVLQLREASESAALRLSEDSLPGRGAQYVTGERFYRETGNDYRGEFRTMAEAWNLQAEGVLSRVVYKQNESEHVPLRTCAWLDVCSHASLWWTDHQRRGFYAAAVQAYHVESTDVSQNRVMWSLSRVASGTRTGTLMMFSATRECSIHVDGGTFSSFDIGWLESRRALPHVYRLHWNALDVAATAPQKMSTSALLLMNSTEVSPVRRCAPAAAAHRGASRITVVALSLEECIVGLETIMTLVQVHSTSPLSTGALLLLTHRTQAVRPGQPVYLRQAGWWGLVRAARQEAPGLRATSIDFSGSSPFVALAAPIEDEPELALAAGRQLMLAPRLCAAREALQGSVQLNFAKRGALANLVVMPQAEPSASCGDDEVELRVRAVGLNFRDVLNVRHLLSVLRPLGHASLRPCYPVRLGHKPVGRALLHRYWASIPATRVHQEATAPASSVWSGWRLRTFAWGAVHLALPADALPRLLGRPPGFSQPCRWRSGLTRRVHCQSCGVRPMWHSLARSSSHRNECSCMPLRVALGSWPVHMRAGLARA